MFYSNEILNFKSNTQIGLVWLAATVGPKSSSSKRLGRREISTLNVQETCDYLRAPPQPLSLRLSASLMVGVSRVYGQQCYYHYTDVQGLCNKLTQINAASTNPESLDLSNQEKKGSNNITLKKIDCISAVNMISSAGSNANFPDFDLTSLLASTESKLSLTFSTSAIEIGRRKASLSSLTGGDLRSSLQGTDFSSVLPSSENERFDDGIDPIEIIPLRGIFPSDSDNAVIADSSKRSQKRRKNLMIDRADELMLGKDQLFITDAEMRSTAYTLCEEIVNDPIKEALKLLNNPQDQFLQSDNNGNLFPSLGFVYSESKSPAEIMNYGFDENNYDDIEVYRAAINESPASNQELNLPWSTSSNRSSSSFFPSNTPLGKGLFNSISNSSIPSTPSPLLFQQTPFDELKPISSTSSLQAFSSSSAATSKSQFSLSKESFDFFYFLQAQMEDSNDWMAFKDQLIQPSCNTKAVAARAFHHLLELKTANLIDLKQKTPFSEIKISLK